MMMACSLGSLSSLSATLIRAAGVRRPAIVLMDGDKQHVRIVPEDFLGSITVMDIIIQDGDSFGAPTAHGMLSSDGDVVEDAGSHSTGWFGVVSRVIHKGVPGIDFAGHYSIHHGARCSSCKSRYVVAASSKSEPVTNVYAIIAVIDGFYSVYILLLVARKDLFFRCILRLHRYEMLQYASDFDNLVTASLNIWIGKIFRRWLDPILAWTI